MVFLPSMDEYLKVFDATIKGAKDFIRKPINKEDFLHVIYQQFIPTPYATYNMVENAV